MLGQLSTSDVIARCPRGHCSCGLNAVYVCLCVPADATVQYVCMASVRENRERESERKTVKVHAAAYIMQSKLDKVWFEAS